LRSSILETITTLVEGLPLGQPIDWVNDVSAKISRMVFSEVMGLPVSDGELFEKWAKTSMDAALTVEDKGDHYRATLNACAQYFREASNGSADHRGHNLLSMLIQANAVNGRGDEDLMADIMILLIGGIETVKHAMTGSIILFNRFPSELVKLRADSALLASAMSEVLRLQTPFPYMRRTALMDIDFHGVTFKKGSKIALWYIAANRDKDHFADPHTFSISRENSGSHLSFGSGPHQCIGKHLALMELELLWRVLIERGLVVKPLAPARKINSSFVNGFASLSVELQRSD
jgi:cytochrome P450